MSADPLAIRLMLRRHLSKRHPNQNWVTRLLMRRMTLKTLAVIHMEEHERFGPILGHADDDFTAAPAGDA